ncbi:MAG: pyrimidine/purine nucleoside phosphorylase [Rhodocyclaceae bacterium]|nr:pyrimidine/purine nucleoside phosphorylase [Rhodocyclaceae bacterium]
MDDKSFSGVTVDTVANVYFDGRCVSHSLRMPDGSRKSVGVVLPSRLSFGTGVAERMDCVGGACRVLLPGEDAWRQVSAGQSFEVPADSRFEIEVAGEPFHYVCHYLD